MSTMHVAPKAVLHLLQTHANKPVCLVAIDGHSAAGKSTLARAIQQALPKVTIVHMDDFYRPMNEDERASLDAEAGYHHYYDWQRLEKQVLAPITASKLSRYQKYDWAAHQLGGWDEVRSEGIILVEGCYAARPELKHYYDVIILVETSPKLREQRQVERADAAPDWWARWDAAERFYMVKQRPQTYADLLVAGE